MLHGQAYANQPLGVDFLTTPAAPRPALDHWNATIADVKARLNPNAAPFSLHTSFTQDNTINYMSFEKDQGLSASDSAGSNIPSGLVGNPYPSSIAPMMPRPVMYNSSSLCPPVANHVRPNSAPTRYVYGFYFPKIHVDS